MENALWIIYYDERGFWEVDVPNQRRIALKEAKKRAPKVFPQHVCCTNRRGCVGSQVTELAASWQGPPGRQSEILFCILHHSHLIFTPPFLPCDPL